MNLINRKELLERIDGDMDFLEEIAACLSEDLSTYIRTLDQGLQTWDWNAISTTAHAIAGMVGNFCADEVQNAAKVLEGAADSKNCDETSRANEQLKEMLLDLGIELNTLISAGKGAGN